MSRRARADLIRFGRVGPGRPWRCRKTRWRSAGDRIMARRNEHGQGARGRTLANRDLYQVDEVLPDGPATVRLVLGRDEVGRVDLGAPRTLPAAYLREHAQLAYGRTSIAVQGATFARQRLRRGAARG